MNPVSIPIISYHDGIYENHALLDDLVIKNKDIPENIIEPDIEENELKEGAKYVKHSLLAKIMIRCSIFVQKVLCFIHVNTECLFD